MRRLLFWALVLLTIAAVSFGVWYYLRDDYPFQLTSGEITGLSYQAGASGLVESGTVAAPPAGLADWVSTMEQDASDAPIEPTGVATIHLADGRSLSLAVDYAARIALGRWVSSSGREGAEVRVHLGQDMAWYLQGVHDGLSGQAPQTGPTDSQTTSPSPGVTSSSPAASSTP